MRAVRITLTVGLVERGNLDAKKAPAKKAKRGKGEAA